MVGVRRTEAGDPLGVRCRVLFHAEPAAIRESGRETVLGADEIEAVREQAILVRGKKRRAGKQAQIHRVEVVAKARPGDFRGLDRAAGHVGALDDQHLPAFGGEMQRGRQAVDAGADHDCVVGHRVSVAPRIPLAAGSLASADISYLKCSR